MNTLNFISVVIDLKQLEVAIALLIQISDFYILCLQIAVILPIAVSGLSPGYGGDVTKGEVSLYAQLLDTIGSDDSKSHLWPSCLLCVFRLDRSLVPSCRERWGLPSFKSNYTNAIILTMQCYETSCKGCNSIAHISLTMKLKVWMYACTYI